ncbi:hypothetical protein BC833DRAFT_584888 [Globomyces pollinis-pini]|nr:hypothetical protein BC833DRAFT_584888 [Globomyces pollinis-pini]
MGSHRPYNDAVELLELDYLHACKAAEIFQSYQLDCAQRIFEDEYKAAIDDYKLEHSSLQEQMLENLESRKRKLLEDKELFDSGADASLETTRSIGTRKTARIVKLEDTRRRPKKPVVPTLSFSVSNADAEADLEVLRRVYLFILS